MNWEEVVGYLDERQPGWHGNRAENASPERLAEVLRREWGTPEYFSRSGTRSEVWPDG